MSKLAKLWDRLIYGEPEIPGLIEASLDAYKDSDPHVGDIRLMLAIVAQAAVDRDLEYFKSLAFKEHCWLLRLNKNKVFQFVKFSWEHP